MSLENVKTPNIVTLQQIVFSMLNEMGIYSKENYLRYCQLAIDGVSDLYMHSAPAPEVVYLTSTSNGIVDLPQDFRDYYKIGIRRNGQIWTLTRNDRLLLPRTEACGEVSAEEVYDDHAITADESTTGSTMVYYTPHFCEGNYVSTLYGAIGGINSGYFRIDYERNQLILSNTAPGTTIIIEYRSSGVSMSQATLVPADARPYVVAYIHWKRTQFDNLLSASFRAEMKQNFIEAEESYRTKRYLAFTVDDYLDSLYEGIHGSIKR